MFDDVIVGEPNGIQYCSSIRLEYYENISENRDQYWVHNVVGQFLGGMKIFKDSDEGKELVSRVANKEPEKLIFEWLKRVFIKHASPETVLGIIKNISDSRFRDGVRSKQLEMIKVLGLKEY